MRIRLERLLYRKTVGKTDTPTVEIKENDMTMNKATVREIIKARGTKFATVTFIKKDGSERKVNGLFRPASHIIGNARGRVISETMKANGYIPIFSVSDNSWKCFHEDSVIEVV